MSHGKTNPPTLAEEWPIRVPNDRQLEQLTQLRLARVRQARVRRRILHETGHIVNLVLPLLRPHSYPHHPTALQWLQTYEIRILVLMNEMKILRAEESLNRAREAVVFLRVTG
ncbi:hypothetical protein N7447_008545 [Penicillium robsamsonii]|uniref:uncharacterized protein n=1 Tax=Penicillium robsamsonii TaxID=1792511 RepID=UPI002548487A|nr:uncharacterized protein N7447_008545 [Penicillium robsamsonii]KAJ5816312.1 hypothetical protein N7447_008545 [Penicillium robsamsonii]